MDAMQRVVTKFGGNKLLPCQHKNKETNNYKTA
jgi:hypothetical protein